MPQGFRDDPLHDVVDREGAFLPAELGEEDDLQKQIAKLFRDGTSASTDDEARELLKNFNFPFRT